MRPVEDEQEEDNFGGDDGEEFAGQRGAAVAGRTQGEDSTAWEYRYSSCCCECRGARSTRTTTAAAPQLMLLLVGTARHCYCSLYLSMLAAALASIWRGKYGKRGCISRLGRNRASLPGDRWPGALVN